MARITNEQLATQISGLDTRLESLEGQVKDVQKVLMNRRNGSVSPMAILLIRWVIFPLIVVVGSVIGATQILPL